MSRKKITRRTVLRGVANGAVVSVALPFLDCFLDDSGTAFAGTNEPLPVVFATWFQHLGFTPGRWIPQKVGRGFEHNIELKVFDRFRDRMNLISGMQYFLDGHPVETHTTGAQIATMGAIPLGNDSPASIDSIVADAIGTRTRFRSIEVALNGGRSSYSKRKGTAVNPSEPSPAALYTRIFGPDFKDPNAAEFTPDPAVLAKRSVLSYVSDQRKSLMGSVGAADRARLDDYFTSLRQIEQKLTIELQKPAPLAACTVPPKIPEADIGDLVDQAQRNAKLFGGLLAHALACGQTRVVNIMMGSQGLRKQGSINSWHSFTHFEPVDARLGYQPETTWFVNWANHVFADFLATLDGIKEGDGTLLDRMLILWQTDHGYARTHTMDNVPVMTVGRAGGRMKTGIHYSGVGDPTTRVGLTVQQVMGVRTDRWGALSNATTKPITELLA
jgi:hypothetical protein